MRLNPFIKKEKRFSFRQNRHLFALAGIAGLSFWFNFYAISQVGYGNAYYAAAIRSMTQSFKNFFFLAFDPAGVVSVDKSPLALWVQALFVMVFGYHGWAMLLPQALAGTGSCILMYVLTAKYFGRPAGLISALVFALTPAVVVASRNNTMDMQLILVLLVATWFLFRAIETGKWRFLFSAAVWIGLGFNIKMLQAYMILPAVGIVYLLFSKEKWSRRILGSVLSLCVLAAVSFAWVAAVDLYPAADRPYVGSSTNNTELELMVGHNGAERLYGQTSGGGSFQGSGGQNGRGTDGRQGNQDNQNGPGANNGTQTNNTTGQTTAANGSTGNQAFSGQNNFSGNGAPSGGNGQSGTFSGRTGGAVGNDIGTAGLLRLWGSTMLGQASWLILFALFGIAAGIRKFSFKQAPLKQGVLVYWAIWLTAMLGFFSFASFYHRYYLCMLAPGIAGLVGIGLPAMIRAFREKEGWRQWLLPAALLSTLLVEGVYIWGYPELRVWLLPVMAVFGLAAFALMAVVRIRSKRRMTSVAMAICLLISILTGPFYWSLTAVWYVPQNSTMPYAGPELADQSAVQGMTPNQETFVTMDSKTLSLEKYLVAHYKQGSYLVVAARANDVAGFIVDTGLPAVAYGGFLGSDNAITLDRFKELVSEGKITYVMLSQQSSVGSNSNSEITSYVKENATLIDSSEYTDESAENDSSTSSNIETDYALYCFNSQQTS